MTKVNELFEYLKNNGDDGWGYSVENAIYGAKEEGLVSEVEELGCTDLRERRWGVSRLHAYRLDGNLIGVEVYEMYSESGEHQFEDVYEVEAYEYTETRYRKV